MTAESDKDMYSTTVSTSDMQLNNPNVSGAGSGRGGAIRSVIIENAEGEINMLIGFFVMNGVYIEEQRSSFITHLDNPTTTTTTTTTTAVYSGKHSCLASDLNRNMKERILVNNRQITSDIFLSHNGCLQTSCPTYSAPLSPCNVLYSEL
uniref:Phlebovirus glycoprotein G2 fusion domain-containing protein n=1 Tax=Syphacia muris TaxID=451379 RepID=A0A0N5AZC8_9BILA